MGNFCFSNFRIFFGWEWVVYVFWESPRVNKRSADEEAEGPEVDYQIKLPVIWKVVLRIFLWGVMGGYLKDNLVRRSCGSQENQGNVEIAPA